MKKVIFLSFFLILISVGFVQTTDYSNPVSPSVKNIQFGDSVTTNQQSQKDICNEINAKVNATLIERLNCAVQIDYTIISFFKEMVSKQDNLIKELDETKKQLQEMKIELRELRQTINSSTISSSNQILTGMNVLEDNQNTEKENKGFFGFFRRLFE